MAAAKTPDKAKAPAAPAKATGKKVKAKNKKKR
jgi:hypothetical protein